MAKLSFKDVNLRDKRVLTRVDFNVPIDNNGNILDDTRIRKVLPIIKYILQNKGKGKLILASHLGRPKAREETLKMDKVGKKLEDLLKAERIGEFKVTKLDDCIGEQVEKYVKRSKENEIILLENLRFYKEEENNDDGFARKLAFLGDIYINDAFSASHRAHASIVGVPKYLKTAMGVLFEKEINSLTKLISSPERPYLLILGGAKVSDKLPLLKNLIKIVDEIIIGGAMAYTFIAAKGVPVGKSKVETNLFDTAKELLSIAESKNIKINLPVDHLTAEKIENDAKIFIEETISSERIGVDIGPKTTEQFSKRIKEAKTIFWNGPMGVYEIPRFQGGTKIIANEISKSKAFKVAGGGDTQGVVINFNLEDKFDLVSTGGGATLEFLEGKELPGYAAIHNK